MGTTVQQPTDTSAEPAQPASRDELARHVLGAITRGEVPVPAGLNIGRAEVFVFVGVEVPSLADVQAWGQWLAAPVKAGERTAAGYVHHRARGEWRGRQIDAYFIEAVAPQRKGKRSGGVR